MINNVNIIGLIPARKNSKVLKNKNLQKISGLTLFEIAAISSLKSKFINETYVSSDSDKILSLGKKLNIKLFRRKSKYAKSTTDANQVILAKHQGFIPNISRTMGIRIRNEGPFLFSAITSG